MPFQWTDGLKRLIVFGDSWSDNGLYLIDPPPEDQVFVQDAARGQAWTHWLCVAVSCVHHDNFARPPIMSTSSLGVQGAVIDNSLLNSTWMAQQHANHSGKVSQMDIKDPAADLKVQVQHWLAYEKTQLGTSRSTEAEKQSTLFSFCFTFWEIWYYSGAVYSNAQVAVTKSMDTLFEQLDLIAENWTSDLKIVILNAIDLTFLPRWRKVRTGPYGSDPFSEDQRNAVLLVEQWNIALAKRVNRWKKGQIFIYDLNKWLMHQIRQGELQNKNWNGVDGLIPEKTVWQNVESGCLMSSDQPLLDILLDNNEGNKCSDPSTFLFWDDYHLGPAATKAVGEDVASIILGRKF